MWCEVYIQWADPCRWVPCDLPTDEQQSPSPWTCNKQKRQARASSSQERAIPFRDREHGTADGSREGQQQTVLSPETHPARCRYGQNVDLGQFGCRRNLRNAESSASTPYTYRTDLDQTDDTINECSSKQEEGVRWPCTLAVQTARITLNTRQLPLQHVREATWMPRAQRRPVPLLSRPGRIVGTGTARSLRRLKPQPLRPSAPREADIWRHPTLQSKAEGRHQ